MTDFRQNVLTIAGVIGYVGFLVLVGLSGHEAFVIPDQWLFAILLSSSSLLGVDFGLDVFGRGTNRPKKPKK